MFKFKRQSPTHIFQGRDKLCDLHVFVGKLVN